MKLSTKVLIGLVAAALLLGAFTTGLKVEQRRLMGEMETLAADLRQCEERLDQR